MSNQFPQNHSMSNKSLTKLYSICIIYEFHLIGHSKIHVGSNNDPAIHSYLLLKNLSSNLFPFLWSDYSAPQSIFNFSCLQSMLHPQHSPEMLSSFLHKFTLFQYIDQIFLPL